MEVIPTIRWIARGAAKKHPDKVQLDKEELKRIIAETKSSIDSLDGGDNEDALNDEEDNDQEEKERAKSSKSSKKKHKLPDDEDDIVAKYDLDNYEDDEDDHISRATEGLGDFAYYGADDEDPYITLKEEESDEEDFEIKPTDNLIVLGKVDKESACVLEVHVYNEELGQLYPHHDYILPTAPLVVEWFNYDIADGELGNFVAVGSMEPTIDIWDLDVVDSLEPIATLGTKETGGKKKKKKKLDTVGHTAAVLDLSWNKNVRNVLASASADHTIALWDLSEGKVVASLKHHTDMVQCVKWHPEELQCLLSGGFDHTVKVFDCRNPEETHRSWEVKGEVECLLWNQHAPTSFFAGTDNGFIQCFDVRRDKPLFTISAHDGEAVTGITLSRGLDGLLASVSRDQTFRVWDMKMKDSSVGIPSLLAADPLVLKKRLSLGALYSVDSCPEAPFVFAIGGEKEFKVWDIRESAKVRNRFIGRMPTNLAAECKEDLGDISDDAVEAMETLSLDTVEASQSEESKKHKKKKKKKKMLAK